ncbi:MAG: hypothetical protein JXA90_08155 [Planctomycetes bacterium]|nr:hypothetical protein [Planctomycetota bacterium]
MAQELVVAPPQAPRLRGRLTDGRMAVYEVTYGDVDARDSPEHPGRLYVTAADLYEPGLWGRTLEFRSEKPRLIRERGKTITEDGTWFGRGSAWNVASLSRYHFGVVEYFRPNLHGFYDPEGAPARVPVCESPVFLFDVEPHPPVFSPESGTWIVRGQWPYELFNSTFGKNGALEAAPVESVFDPERSLFTRISIQNAHVTGDRYFNPRRTTSLSFELKGVEPFPPPDLAGRIERGIRSGVDFIERDLGRIDRVIWAREHALAVPSLLAWALLAGGGSTDRAEALLLAALKNSPRTTYDAAFLILALDALLERRSRDLIDSGAAGRTAVATALSGRSRVEGILKKAVAFLVRGRAGETDLWGYLPEIHHCEEPGKCLFTYCDSHLRFRRGEEVADSSNTFWAADALAVASERGIAIPRRVCESTVKALERWGTYMWGDFLPRGRRLWSEEQRQKHRERPTEAEPYYDLLDGRDLRDRTLRYVRGLRPAGARPWPDRGPQTLAGVEWRGELERVRAFVYPYFGAERPMHNVSDVLRYSHAVQPFPSQIGGVGALSFAYGALGRDPLEQRTVQEALLWARIFFRYSLGASDIPKGKDYGSKVSPHGLAATTASPGDLGYNFLIVERLLDYLGIEEFGRRQWYPLLALHALDFQKEDGGWYAWRDDRLVPAALFVLFLARSRASRLEGPLPLYEAPIETGEARERGDRPLLVAAPGGKHYRGDDVIATLRVNSTRERLAMAEQALAAATDAQKLALVPLLIRAAREGPAPSKSLAREALGEITGVKKGGEEQWAQWYRERTKAAEIEETRDTGEKEETTAGENDETPHKE